MPIEVPTPSNFLGAQSPHWLAVALNTGGLSFASNSSDVTALTVVRAEMPRGFLHFIFRISEGFANNESLEIALTYVTLDGTTVVGESLTLDDSNTPVGGGAFEIDLSRDPPIPVGSIVSLARIYTAGGQANNPVVAALVQLY
jgi:hypothetical protein